MDEPMKKSGQWPNVAIPAGSDPEEVMREYGVKAIAATLGSVECEVVKEHVDIGGERMTDYTCCLNQPGWGHNFCPNCGKMVKR